MQGLSKSSDDGRAIRLGLPTGPNFERARIRTSSVLCRGGIRFEPVAGARHCRQVAGGDRRLVEE
jgi:hypothetical protein